MSTPWNPNYKRKSKTYTSPEVKDRWNRKHYDQITIRCGIGGRKLIQDAAAAHGMSMAEYLRHLVIADNPENADISAILGGGGNLIGYNYSHLPDNLRQLLDL